MGTSRDRSAKIGNFHVRRRYLTCTWSIGAAHRHPLSVRCALPLTHPLDRVLPSPVLASADRRVMPCSPVLAPTAACFPRLCLHRPTTACCPRPCLRRPPRPCCPCSPRLCSCRNRLPSAERAPRAALARVLASTAPCRPYPCSRRLPRVAVLASSVLSPPSPVPESAAGCRGRSGCLAGHLRAQW